MKQVLTILLFLFFISSVSAEELAQIKYKNLKNGTKITNIDDYWSTKIKRSNKNYFIKKIPEGTINFTEFYSPNGEFLFSTATNYEFLYKDSLIGYSNLDMKFYEFSIKDNLLKQRELIFEEVQNLFPEFEIIKVNDFSETNSYKIKKKKGKIKLILLNDTDKTFYNYEFSTNNAKFEKYSLKGFLNIKEKGMIHFSNNNSNPQNKDWFIILVR